MPMVVTELGIVMLVSLVKPLAKYAGILSTLFPMLMVEMVEIFEL